MEFDFEYRTESKQVLPTPKTMTFDEAVNDGFELGAISLVKGDVMFMTMASCDSAVNKDLRDWLVKQLPFTKQELVDLMGESAR